MRIFISTLTCMMLCSVTYARETHPGVASALRFTDSLRAGNLATAYDELAEKFRNVNSIEAFRGFVEETGIASLSDFEVKKATANQDQSVMTVILSGKNADGKTRGTWIGLVKEPDSYRVDYFMVRNGGATGIPPVKDPEAATKLAQGALERLAESIRTGSFASYLSKVPMKFRQEFGDDTIIRIGKQLNETRYGPVSDMAGKLEFDGPGSWENGLARYRFVVAYPEWDRKLRLHFLSQTAQSDAKPWPNRWELVFFPSSGTPPSKPDATETSRLVRRILSDLFAGFREGDLKSFYSKGAPFFREVVPLSRFSSAFPAFTGGNAVDYSAWKPGETEILEEVLIGKEQANWKLEVAIPTSSQPAYATVNLLHEEDAWRFAGVTFHSKSPEQRRNPSGQ